MHNDAKAIRAREQLAGLILIGASAVAFIAANTALAPAYDALLHLHFGPALPRIGVPSLHDWVAEALMALFFMLVGLEVKREWLRGQLASSDQRKLPLVAAIAGMAIPALVFLAVTRGDPALLSGWAIPSATDIAFAIAVLALLGDRASPQIKLLLVAIAIVDDVGAVVIIALFYSQSLSLAALALAAAIAGAMMALNRFGVRRLWPYLLLFAALWLAVLASGVHATIAGVVAALTIPLGARGEHSPLRHLEHAIHPWVMFGVMPLFGFASAGVAIDGGLEMFLAPLPLGVAAGLFLGKQLGVFGATWLAVRAGFCKLPAGASWQQVYGAALLCGIGFTMSLFIGELAFADNADAAAAAKLGTLAGSLLSAVVGFIVLRLSPPLQSDEGREELDDLFAMNEEEDHRPRGSHSASDA
ncbi:Na+/H+ antiporter NhaA [Sphingomonas sabuli]|uniref:Na(+)/H(+) antiporter NhaA n=1 Tax=Sphingomonas sabuli TaxID=2764186 RepID=A0A7G9L0S9_9SPHN|nr:Na+/H+ antiporter NhaA [Sphingomonas sabuli]QNM82228.1 Na+/H+ antiporter NhaA [Sphingomonas sabuli]